MLNKIFLTICLFFWVSAAFSQDRLALIVGNSNYDKIGTLDNPANDAKLMKSTLETVGFKVISVLDADLNSFRKTITEFGRELRKTNAVGLFYYAGHGVQANGENYLIPVDAAISDEAELAWQSVRMSDVMRSMKRDSNQMNIVILDACRNNPFPTKSRNVKSGLASIEAPKGAFVAYATAPGQVALDGIGDNSPYSLALASAISTAGLTLEETFKNTRQEVLETTSQGQTPWETSSITGVFHFTAPEKQNIALLQNKLRDQKALIDRLKNQKNTTNENNEEINSAVKECNNLTTSPDDNRVKGEPSIAFSELQTHAGKAIELCLRAVEGRPNNDRLKYQLARALMAIGDRDLEAAEWMREAADNYYPAAMNGLGILKYFGYGIAVDQEDAFQLFSAAAEKGHIAAMTNLGAGIMSSEISGNPFDGIKWIRKATEEGDLYATMHLGYQYASGGNAIVKDIKKSLNLLDKSIEQGVAEATYMKLQVYGFAILDGSADPIRRRLSKESIKSGIRTAMVDEYYTTKKRNLLEKAIKSKARHQTQGYEPIYTSSVYFDREKSFRDSLDFIAKSEFYPKADRILLENYLRDN